MWKAFIQLMLVVLQGNSYEIKPCISSWFQGLPLNLTCVGNKSNSDSIGGISLSRDKNPVGQCDSGFKNCFSLDPAHYSVSGIPWVSVTVLIKSFQKGRDDVNWTCTDSSALCYIHLSPQYSVKHENVTSLGEIGTPVSVSVVGHCTYLEPNCTWTYRIGNQSVEEISSNSTHITQTSELCDSGEQQTTCSLVFDSVPEMFAGKTVSLVVTITHPSLVGNSTPVVITNAGVIFSNKVSADHKIVIGEIVAIVASVIVILIAIPSSVFVYKRMKKGKFKDLSNITTGFSSPWSARKKRRPSILMTKF